VLRRGFGCGCWHLLLLLLLLPPLLHRRQTAVLKPFDRSLAAKP